MLAGWNPLDEGLGGISASNALAPLDERQAHALVASGTISGRSPAAGPTPSRTCNGKLIRAARAKDKRERKLRRYVATAAALAGHV